MKRSGRTLKQRLQDISYLPSYIRRARYFRGHGVHSPFVYDIVRKVFMQSKLYTSNNALYEALMDKGVAKRRSVQLANLAEHCRYDNWSIDRLDDKQMIIATLDTRYTELEEYAKYARERGATLCIITPYNNRERWEVCQRIIDAHPSTTVDNRAYLLVFNNHLPKQRFRL
ncbi:MAG: hypothetical protein J6U93_03880 [Alistipes sp.]|nr:hypothetical protein [Alistipes sp.]MBO7263645.1 hypothetical protein [Alistipes sp.]